MIGAKETNGLSFVFSSQQADKRVRKSIKLVSPILSDNEKYAHQIYFNGFLCNNLAMSWEIFSEIGKWLEESGFYKDVIGNETFWTAFGSIFSCVSILVVFIVTNKQIKSNKSIEDQRNLREDIGRLQAVRPFIDINFMENKETEITLYFAKPNVWIKNINIFFDKCDSRYQEDGELSNMILIKQMVSAAKEKIYIPAMKSDEEDRDFPFLIEAETLLNEKIHIYHFPGDSNCYFFDPENFLKNDSFNDNTGYSSMDSIRLLKDSCIKDKIVSFDQKINSGMKIEPISYGQHNEDGYYRIPPTTTTTTNSHPN